jgi:hypothetical protein
MKLCAIYNVWADWDILEYSLKNIEPLVDGVIIVGSTKSNFGEYFPIPENFRDRVAIREPQFANAAQSETDKRNFGLDLARWAGFTHFITIDADEFYDPTEFNYAKDIAENVGIGLVCTCTTYFAKPTLCIGLDITLVPHIHELTPTIKHSFNRRYPFAWNGPQIRIDPTRSLNINEGVFMTDITMHHFSWIRSDFNRKIRNSTAKANLERSTILEDLLLAKDGYFCKFYQKHLHTVVNRFNIPDYGVLDQNLQSLATANQKHKSR